jgi:hypothetical protein
VRFPKKKKRDSPPKELPPGAWRSIYISHHSILQKFQVKPITPSSNLCSQDMSRSHQQQPSVPQSGQDPARARDRSEEPAEAHAHTRAPKAGASPASVNFEAPERSASGLSQPSAKVVAPSLPVTTEDEACDSSAGAHAHSQVRVQGRLASVCSDA